LGVNRVQSIVDIPDRAILVIRLRQQVPNCVAPPLDVQNPNCGVVNWFADEETLRK